MVQVPGCGCGGHCATVIPYDGLCKPDGSPLLVLQIVNCHGDEIVSNIVDPETGLPYVGPIIQCNALSVTDTDSIDLTLVDNNLSADLILDPSSTAPVEITEDGLKVDCCPDTGGWITQVKTETEIVTDTSGIGVADLTGFVVDPNAVYEFEGKVMMSSSVGNNGTRSRLQFPAGMASIAHTTRSVDGSAGLESIAYGGPSTLTGSSNVPLTTTPYLIAISGIVDTGPTPGVTPLKPLFASETGAITRVWRGSMFKWRRLL